MGRSEEVVDFVVVVLGGIEIAAFVAAVVAAQSHLRRSQMTATGTGRQTHLKSETATQKSQNCRTPR